MRDAELGTRLMTLCRAIDYVRMPEVSRELVCRALHPEGTTAERHIRAGEREIRCYLRKEPGPHLEQAIARLLCAIIVSKLEGPTEVPEIETDPR